MGVTGCGASPRDDEATGGGEAAVFWAIVAEASFVAQAVAGVAGLACAAVATSPSTAAEAGAMAGAAAGVVPSMAARLAA